MADRYDYENRGRGWRDINDDEEDYNWQDDPARREAFAAQDRENVNRPYERESRWERTRQWRSGQNPREERGRGASSYGAGYHGSGQDEWRDSEVRRRWNAERDRYREDDNRSQGSIYNRDWYDWNYDRDNDYDEFGSGPGYGWSTRWPEDRYTGQRGRGMQQGRFSQQNQPYPTAGMNSDYGGRFDYENRPRMRERLNYDRGDIGYDNEGAFYQDMDEPVNYEVWDIWTIPDTFTGIGPMGYQRTDERIQEDLCERLTQHGWIDASDLEIQVQNGEVTLKGTVPDRQMKRLAEDAAEDITGVKDIHNEIKVQKRQGGRNWSRYEQNRSHDQGTRTWESQWPEEVQTGMAGDTTAGAGLTDAGATSLTGMEAGSAMDENRHSLKEGMEVIGNDGKAVGRVKEIRSSDFLLNRELARDIFVPIAAIQSVGAQVMLNIASDTIDEQDWPKPDLM